LRDITIGFLGRRLKIQVKKGHFNNKLERERHMINSDVKLYVKRVLGIEWREKFKFHLTERWQKGFMNKKVLELILEVMIRSCLFPVTAFLGWVFMELMEPTRF